MSDNRVEIGSGRGVIVADTGGTWYVSSDAPSARLAEVAAAVSERPAGRLLARRLAALLTSDAADDVPSFGLVADMDDGVLVFLSGSVEAAVTGADGTRTVLSGRSAATWVDRVFPADTLSIVVAPAVADVPADDQPFNLSAGVVPGGWFRAGGAPAGQSAPSTAESAPDAAVPASPAASPSPSVASVPAAEPDVDISDVPAASALPPPPPVAGPAADAPPAAEPAASADSGAAPAAEPAPAEPFVSFEVAPDRTTIREPLPVDAAPAADDAGAASASTAAEPTGELVEGILCSRQHFNSPNAKYCSSCGISMVHQTHHLVTRERPQLGYLVFDDGSTFSLDGQYVLGREPQEDPKIGAGVSRPITLDDPEMSVSRVHAEILLVGWDVQFIDRGSTNGSHVWNEDEGAWQRMSPDEPQILRPGVRGAVGQRTFIYESPHHR